MKLNEKVWFRVVQLVQVGLLTMTDVTEQLELIEVEPTADDPNVLQPTKEAELKIEAYLKSLEQAALGKASRA